MEYASMIEQGLKANTEQNVEQMWTVISDDMIKTLAKL